MADILLIDDMKGVRRAIRATLDRAGHAVIEAVDGAAGIALLGGSQKFDLVITDMMMPGKDGADIILFVKSLARGPKCLAISGGGSAVSLDQALGLARMKADAVLAKPFDAAELLEAVNKLLAPGA